MPRADPRIRQPRPDGRLGSLDRGAAAGMSEHTTRRRLQRMARDSVITFRCGPARPLAGLSTRVPPHGGPPHPSRGTGNAPARREEVRLAVSVSDSDNLLVMVWLRGPHAVDPFEAQLAERFPHLKISDGTAFLHSRTRMGRLPDTTGRATGYTPFSLSQVRPRSTASGRHPTSLRRTAAGLRDGHFCGGLVDAEDDVEHVAARQWPRHGRHRRGRRRRPVSRRHDREHRLRRPPRRDPPGPWRLPRPAHSSPYPLPPPTAASPVEGPTSRVQGGLNRGIGIRQTSSTHPPDARSGRASNERRGDALPSMRNRGLASVIPHTSLGNSRSAALSDTSTQSTSHAHGNRSRPPPEASRNRRNSSS